MLNVNNRPVAAQREERTIRVEDHLNDKIQTNADLENLDNLLDSVRRQQALLKQQVRLWIQIHRLVADK